MDPIIPKHYVDILSTLIVRAPIPALWKQYVCPRLAVLQNHFGPWHPVGSLAVNQMADNVVHRPGFAAFIPSCPHVGQITQECVERGRRAVEQRHRVRQIVFHRTDSIC